MLYGEKWLAAAEPLRIIVLAGFSERSSSLRGTTAARTALVSWWSPRPPSDIRYLGLSDRTDWGLQGVAWALVASAVFSRSMCTSWFIEPFLHASQTYLGQSPRRYSLTLSSAAFCTGYFVAADLQTTNSRYTSQSWSSLVSYLRVGLSVPPHSRSANGGRSLARETPCGSQPCVSGVHMKHCVFFAYGPYDDRPSHFHALPEAKLARFGTTAT